MKRFALTVKARADLKSIARFTEQEWGAEQRNLYVKQFFDTFETLGRNPGLGRPCGEIAPGYSKYPLGSHVIFYRVDADSLVLVVRILHKRMDAGRHLATAR